MTEIVLADTTDLEEGRWQDFLDWLRNGACASLLAQHSGSTARAYAKALEGFLDLLEASQHRRLDRQAMASYRAHLEDRGLSPATINQRLSAVRGLLREASEMGVVDPRLAEAIARVKGVRQRGTRLGNWLTAEQAQELLNTPPPDTVKGARDRAILGLLLACGLRRSEIARLTWGHLQQRDGHHVLADIQGKHGRLRTVKVPVWLHRRLLAWAEVGGLDPTDRGARIFSGVNKADRLTGRPLSAQGVWHVWREYAPEGLAAHDARRTFAKLAMKGGAPLQQIQLALGHASIATTDRYLGKELDLDENAVDFTGLVGK